MFLNGVANSRRVTFELLVVFYKMCCPSKLFKHNTKYKTIAPQLAK
jgi:hypothetical protein